MIQNLENLKIHKLKTEIKKMQNITKFNLNKKKINGKHINTYHNLYLEQTILSYFCHEIKQDLEPAITDFMDELDCLLSEYN